MLTDDQPTVTAIGPQSPTTYRALSSSSPPARRSPGLSYATVVARSLSPAGTLETLSLTQEPASYEPPTPTRAVTQTQAPAPSATDTGGVWHVVNNSKKAKRFNKKGKAREVASPRSDASRVSESGDQELSDTSVRKEPRKRRRTADDDGSNELPAVVSPTRIPAPQFSPTKHTRGAPRSRTSNTPANNVAGGSGSAYDIDFAMVSDSDPIESLLFRRSDFVDSSPMTQGRHAGAPSRVDDQLDDISHLIPLFPLPSSSIPPSTPRTPKAPRATRSRTATPKAKPRHHWSDSSDDLSQAPDDPPALQRRSPSSPPEVAMADASPPSRSASRASSSSHRGRQGRGRGRHSMAAVDESRQSSVERLAAEPELPFDVDTLDPDVIIPLPGSFRGVQGDDAEKKHKGMAPVQKHSWDDLDEEEPTLAMMIANHGTEEPGIGEREQMIINLFRLLLRVLGISVLSAYSLTGFHGMNTEPFWYLGRGIPLRVIIALVKLGWLNTSSITLHFDFWRDTNPHLCAMFRLVHRFGAQSKAEYEDVVRRELVESDLYDTLYDVVTRDMERGGVWSNYIRVDALNAIVDSVDVEVLPCKVSQTTWESIAMIYLVPPTTDPRDWLRFCTLLRKHGFGSDAAGHPDAFKGRVCVRQTIGWHENPLVMPQPTVQQQPDDGDTGRVYRHSIYVQTHDVLNLESCCLSHDRRYCSQMRIA
ncbi:hypothetical protein EVJ58_g3519 [Rhodofomes roseus]|uniref:Uncharacterized protein n=1 Tax=Rhodofomes roseus TaxID=34475 RepID=A0A4Y9YKA1_9APHY|nr:hypothetical protein EVJ58_g3519 [Rhodofomes roseus]